MATGKRFSMSNAESALVLVLVSLLAGVLVYYRTVYEKELEFRRLSDNVEQIKKVAMLMTADYVAADRIHELPQHLGDNPVDWLKQWLTTQPLNYAGERSLERVDELDGGTWFFDEQNGLLVYVIEHTDKIGSANTDPRIVAFKSKLLFVDRNRNGRFDEGVDRARQITIAATADYWEKDANS